MGEAVGDMLVKKRVHLFVFNIASIAVISLLVEATDHNKLLTPDKAWCIKYSFLSLAGVSWSAVNILSLKAESKLVAVNVALRSEVGQLNDSLADAERDRKEAVANAEFADSTNRLFLSVVSEKRHRVAKYKADILRIEQAHPDCSALINKAFNSDEQMKGLLAATYQLVRLHMWGLGVSTQSKLRLAIFTVGRRKLDLEWHYTEGGKDQIRGPKYKPHKNKYRLVHGKPAKSLASHVASSQAIFVISNADEADDSSDVPYFHFDDQQRRTIKSIVAIPLGKIGDNGYCRHVLCLDSDQAGVFTKSHLNRFEGIRCNLEERLMLELDYRAVFRQET